MDVSASEAETLAVETAGTTDGPSWEAAADWLQRVEHNVRQAEREAALAIAAANAGAWQEAVGHAHKAWSLEFQTGRPLRHTPTWQRLFRAIKAAARKQGEGE
jgi:hypothetical protein